MKIVKYRSGKNGLYYEDGELIDCTYNRAFGSYLWLVWDCVKDLKGDLEEVYGILKETIKAFLWILLLPVIPFIRALFIKWNALKEIKSKNIPKPNFPSSYYEVIRIYEDD